MSKINILFSISSIITLLICMYFGYASIKQAFKINKPDTWMKIVQAFGFITGYIAFTTVNITIIITAFESPLGYIPLGVLSFIWTLLSILLATTIPKSPTISGA